MQRSGVAYRITYKRRGWKHSHTHITLSERGARSFANKLATTEGVKPLDELRIEIMGGLWVELDDDGPVRRKGRTTKRPNDGMYVVDTSNWKVDEDE